jgi:hypothetical protein
VFAKAAKEMSPSEYADFVFDVIELFELQLDAASTDRRAELYTLHPFLLKCLAGHRHFKRKR